MLLLLLLPPLLIVVVVVAAAAILIDILYFYYLLTFLSFLPYLRVQSIPSTSYFKLVDVWLLFCAVMIVVAILLHTALAAFTGLFGGGGGRGRNRRRENGAFKRIRTPSGSLKGNTGKKRKNKVGKYKCIPGCRQSG